MKNSFALKTLKSRPSKPFKGGLACEECRPGLADFVKEVLEEGKKPEGSPTSLHLEGCPRCSQTYIHLIDLMTAPQVKALQDSLLDPSLSPDNLEELLRLWLMQLAACNRLENLKGAAVGLSVIGMIRRQLRDVGEARLVHELALRTAEEGHALPSKTMSYTDLGYIALRNDRAVEAVDLFTRAQQCAARLTDRETEDRILVLLEQARHKVAATKSFWEEIEENWKRLRTELPITIAKMRASFQNWPPGLRPQPALVPAYRGKMEGSSLYIPEEERQVGYDVELTVSSPSGQRAELSLTLIQQPGGGPLGGAKVMVYDDVGLPLQEKPRITDEKGCVAFQLWPGKYDIAITYQGARREIPFSVVTSPTTS